MAELRLTEAERAEVEEVVGRLLPSNNPNVAPYLSPLREGVVSTLDEAFTTQLRDLAEMCIVLRGYIVQRFVLSDMLPGNEDHDNLADLLEGLLSISDGHADLTWQNEIVTEIWGDDSHAGNELWGIAPQLIHELFERPVRAERQGQEGAA